MVGHPVNINRQLVDKIFLDSDGMARQPVEETIRMRVEALLRARPEIRQQAFGEAIGRGGSWVSAFLLKKRPVTDVGLLVRIARFFPVSAGYLLGEGDRDTDPKTAVLLETWRELGDVGRKGLLGAAEGYLEMQRALEDATSPEESGGGSSAEPRSTPSKRPRPHGPRGGTR